MAIYTAFQKEKDSLESNVLKSSKKPVETWAASTKG